MTGGRRLGFVDDQRDPYPGRDGMGRAGRAGRPRGPVFGAPADRRRRCPPGRPGDAAPDRPSRTAGTGAQGAPAHEIAGLRAAQAVRRQATTVPELVAWGGDWLITPLAPGSPLAWGDAVRRTWSTG